ncbi:MAG: carboxypeptidase-like regulatory domain-containing protein [Acidobacteriota bacterium]|nr:carboxypeptidase-like regulatory domain-containing protein [Acidobacteriota bacterium]
MKTLGLRSVVLALLLFPTLLIAGDKKNDSGLQSNLKIVVLKDDNGKPVRNAAVILHPVKENGKQSKGGFELKTNSEGQTESDGIPYGKLRLQVIAPGFQTFGEDYDINQPEQAVTIRLRRPKDQYSIYPDQAKDKQ